ncbi:hypothetical protein [Halosegnis sp.]|uniref:DUF7124 domain-containing protein n=1 Tax=Halosegnis sp. TaxID=2864959 RepID=UPI0035D4C8FB
MTDSIDLDELEGQDDDEPAVNPGDWLWKEDGDADPEETPDADGGLTGEDLGDRTPRVPKETDGKPVGIPAKQGGAGSGVASGVPEGGGMPDDDGPDAMPGAPEGEPSETPGAPDAGGGASLADVAAGPDGSTPGVPGDADVSGPVGSGSAGSGPHGGDADEMTLAFTYRAARALADPQAACRDAARWTDWLGIVGDVPSHALNKFQRRHAIDLDFFNGSGTRPTERLAQVDASSMFYAKRLVLVGLADEAGMEPDGWEFRPLSEAAEKADWDYDPPE